MLSFYPKLMDLANDIVKDIIAETGRFSLIVVNIEDIELLQLLQRRKIKQRKFEYPRHAEDGRSALILATVHDEARRSDLVLQFGKTPAILEYALQGEEEYFDGCLIGRVQSHQLGALTDDIAALAMRSWPIRAIVFSNHVNAAPQGAKLFNIHDWSIKFEEAVRSTLTQWTAGDEFCSLKENTRSDKWERSMDAVAGGVAGLSDCSFTVALRLLDSIRLVFESEFATKRKSTSNTIDQALEWFHQRSVLRLLKASAPDVVARAETAGVLPELAYGLQRSSLLLGAAPANDLAAVLGDEMPEGYTALANDLVFLRWYEELSGPFPFSSPEEVVAIQDRVTEAKEESHGKSVKVGSFCGPKFLEELANAISPNRRDDLTDDARLNTADNRKNKLNARENNELDASSLQPVFVDLVEILGGSKEYANKLMQGLAVLGESDSIDLVGVRQAFNVASVLKKALKDECIETARDIRLAIVIKLLIKQLNIQLLPAINRWQFECKVQESRYVKNSFVNKIRAFFEAKPRAAPEGQTNESTHLKLLQEGVEEIRKRVVEGRSAVLKNAQVEILELTDLASKHLDDKKILGALLKISRSTSRRLDMSAEKLRFQLYLLQDSWVQAERHLSLLKQQIENRAELSHADVILMEGGLLEAQGQLGSALKKYDSLRQEIDPSVDPVVWTRANYGAIRTHLAMQSKPAAAALAGALSIVDLESQRRAGKVKSAERLFISFRGPAREWAAKFGEMGKQALHVGFEIDKERRASDDFDSTIQLRLLESKYIVIVLTRDYFESPWCISELHTALHLRRFNSDCALGWLFLNSTFASQNRDDAELYVRAQLSVPMTLNLGVNELYLDERFRRLTELGIKVGKGVYSMDEQPTREDWEKFANSFRESGANAVSKNKQSPSEGATGNRGPKKARGGEPA